MRRSIGLVSLVFAAALAAFAHPVSAQDAPGVVPPAIGTSNRNDISATIYGGVVGAPDYEGSNDYRVLPLIFGEVRWGQRSLAVEGDAVRANILNSKVVELGPVAHLTFARSPRRIDSEAVSALGRIDSAFEMGAYGAVRFGSLLTPNDSLRLSVQAVQDVSDVHDGWLGGADLTYRRPISPRLAVAAQASITFTDDKFARIYFSVDAPGTVRSGLGTFDAEGGIKDVAISLTTTYALSDRWSVIAPGGYRRFVGDFRNSPLVRDEGSPNQLFGGLGLGFSF